jgi:hypothetical protein
MGRIKDIFSAVYWSARVDLRLIGNSGGELQAKGWARSPIEMSADEVAQIRHQLSQLAQEEGKEHERRSHDGYEGYDTGMVDIPNLGDLIPKIESLGLVPEFMSTNKGIVEQAADRKVVREQLRVYVNVGITDTRRYHCDSYYDNQYKSFLYLTDVSDLGHGPYCYIEGSNRPSIRRYLNIVRNAFGKYPVTDAHYCRRESETIFLGEAGTAVITNQRGYHRGHPQRPGARRMMLVHAMWVW